jgi:hypothetical protein
MVDTEETEDTRTIIDTLREIYRAFSFAVFAWVVPWFFVGSFKGTPVFWSAWIIQLFTLYPVIIILFSWNYFLRVPDAWHMHSSASDNAAKLAGESNRGISWLAGITFCATAIVMDFLYLGLLRQNGFGYLGYGFPYIPINYIEMLVLPPLVNNFQGRILGWWELKRGVL